MVSWQAAAESPRELSASICEKRKRLDLLLAAFAAIVAADPEFYLVTVGKDSDSFAVPAALAPNVTRLGYVRDEALLEVYCTCTAFLLLSDFEAFWLPIAEALCCGTPAIITHQAETADVFRDMPGVRLVDNADAAAVRDVVLDVARTPPDAPAIAAAAMERFSLDATYGRTLDRVLALLAP